MLEKIGVRGPILRWFKSYLANRKIVVRLGDTQSDEKVIQTGIPQGNDTVVISTHKDFSCALDNLDEDMFNFQLWAHDKKLTINTKKTTVMYIASSHKRVSRQVALRVHTSDCLHVLVSIRGEGVHCNYEALSVVSTQWYLGITIDNTFLWSSHVVECCGRGGCGVSLVGAAWPRGRRRFGTLPGAVAACRSVAGGSEMIPVWLRLDAFAVSWRGWSG
ncbi:hypothetical protein Trydic_g10121 [Trypoxylus dichotomus]